MDKNPNLFLSVGKQLKDEYGRVIGKVASFGLTPSGKLDAVFVEQGNGKFTKHSAEHIKMDGVEVTLISKIKSEANILCDQIPLIWRKSQALKDLYEKKKISRELYNELHNNFNGALNQLKTEAQAITEDIENELARCAEEMTSLNYALVNLELEHEIGKIEDKDYQTAFNIIQENLKKVNTEKTDLELTRSKLSNITLGDTVKSAATEDTKTKPSMAKSSTQSYSTPDLPEPPVVVYVKEIGKTGV